MARGKHLREIAAAHEHGAGNREDGDIPATAGANDAGASEKGHIGLSFDVLKSKLEAAQELDKGLRILSVLTTDSQAPASVRLLMSHPAIVCGGVDGYVTGDGKTVTF